MHYLGSVAQHAAGTVSSGKTDPYSSPLFEVTTICLFTRLPGYGILCRRVRLPLLDVHPRISCAPPVPLTYQAAKSHCDLQSSRNMYFALANGGPAAWIFSYLVVAAGVLCQVATFSEMASIQPIAGAQYYWTWHFAPLALRRFLTWMQGWSTWAGYVALLASCLNGNTVILEGVIQLAHPRFETGGWRTALIMIAMVVFCAVINMYAFWLVPWFELLTGFLNVATVLVIFVVLWAMAPRNSIDVFMQTNVSSGWDNYFVSANLGALSNIYLFICKSHLSCCHGEDLIQN